MMSNNRYPLSQIILDDVLGRNKVALCLLLAIIATGFATVWYTYQTRLLIAEQGKLQDENEKLQYQYLNLRLEEHTWSKRTRIEAVAERFGLQAIKKEQEVILVEQK
ncbi:cell division protein FtsL [Pasteurellaceae bacterium Macca]|nr:cell division protein FtsL [Pasteurellaceae bacterium Macca]